MPGTRIYVMGSSLFLSDTSIQQYVKIWGGEIVFGQNATGIWGNDTPANFVLEDVVIDPANNGQWDNSTIGTGTQCYYVYNRQTGELLN